MYLLYRTLLFWSILFLLTKMRACCKPVCWVPPAVASYIAYLLRLLIASCPLVLDLILCFVQLACCPGLSARSSKLSHTAWVCSRLHHPGVCKCTVWCLRNDERACDCKRHVTVYEIEKYSTNIYWALLCTGQWTLPSWSLHCNDYHEKQTSWETKYDLCTFICRSSLKEVKSSITHSC